MIDGQPVKIGDSVVCRDETSDAWWRASVRDIRGSDVLITFMGCDNAWDTCAYHDSFFFPLLLLLTLSLSIL